MSTATQLGRTYNQTHAPRPYAAGKRRFSIYWSWSYPREANRDTAELDNRFSTMTEVRRVSWPRFEGPEWGRTSFLQGVDGTLELFHRSTLAFQSTVETVTGQPVAVYQRVNQAGYALPIDERILADTDTLMVFSLDHLASEQRASQAEIDAIEAWLAREGTCLLLAPHHDVGFTDDMAQRETEYRHHGDELVPRQQRFSQYARSLMEALGVPVMNQFGLRPAVVEKTRAIAPLVVHQDLDRLGLLRGVTTLNFHQHLPHYAVTKKGAESVRVLAEQPIDPHRPHPFTAAGNQTLNACIWMPPSGRRAGDLLLIDSTHFTTLFGGTDSLELLWRNMATMRAS